MKILKKENVAETRFLNLVNTTYEDKNGVARSWISAERPGNQKAVIIVATVPGDDPGDDDAVDHHPYTRLVVIREFRVPLQDYIWELPAGLVDPGMSAEDTAVKELKEETGLDVTKFIRPVTPFVFSSPGMTNESSAYAFVEASGTFSNNLLSANEDINAFLLSRKQVGALLKNATKEEMGKVLIGAKAWIVFERFVKQGDI